MNQTSAKPRDGSVASALLQPAQLRMVHKLLVDLDHRGIAIGSGGVRNWSDVQCLAGSLRWPHFRLITSQQQTLCVEYRPTSRRQSLQRLFAEEVERLYLHARKWQVPVLPGWLAYPTVPWRSMEEDNAEHGSRTAYRSSEALGRSAYRSVHRSGWKQQIRLLLGFGTDAQYDRLSIDSDWVTRKRFGEKSRIPRSSLRLRSQCLPSFIKKRVRGKWIQRMQYSLSGNQHLHEDAELCLRPSHFPVGTGVGPVIYTFGRNTELVIYDPSRNPIAQELDRQLATTELTAGNSTHS